VRALFDVNMLLALFDSEHIHHAPALSWWTANGDNGWASCPLTQNGFVRVIAGAGYPRSRQMADALLLLKAQIERPDHAFWPDDVTLIDSEMFDHRYLLGPKQITDAYLLALAVKNNGRLVTFDRAISLAAVHGARQKHLVAL
jgi:toxin-antitoxin system PIN domain toxin